MKVKQLIEILQSCDPESSVVTASDPEGNSFSENLTVGDNYLFDGENVGFASLTEGMQASGYSEEDVLESGDPCIVLWP